MSNVIYLHARRPEGLDQVRDHPRRASATRQAESLADATVYGERWEPWEDTLLHRLPSNVAAASALGRTYYAIKSRRKRLLAGGEEFNAWLDYMSEVGANWLDDVVERLEHRKQLRTEGV